MARPIKKGFDYYPFDVSFFSEVKTRVLLSHYGTNGVLLFVYLLSAIYQNGYYARYDDDLLCITSADLQLQPDQTQQMIDFLCERGFFDSRLFKDEKILTSHGIQLRYQEMIKARASRKQLFVEKHLWLLTDNETESYINFLGEESFSEINPSFSEINPSFSQINSTNQSKENKSKVNQNKSNQIKSEQSNASSDDAVDFADDDDEIKEIDNCYFSVTNRHLNCSEKSSLKAFISSGYSPHDIAGTITDIGRKYPDMKISSVNYFLAAVKKGNSARSSPSDRYQPTYNIDDVEAMLDAEWMSLPVGDDSQYTYDD